MLKQQIQHALKVCRRAKNVLPVIASQDNVVRIAGDGETGLASHALHLLMN
jgi:hypothetical protein